MCVGARVCFPQCIPASERAVGAVGVGSASLVVGVCQCVPTSKQYSELWEQLVSEVQVWVSVFVSVYPTQSNTASRRGSWCRKRKPGCQCLSECTHLKAIQRAVGAVGVGSTSLVVGVFVSVYIYLKASHLAVMTVGVGRGGLDVGVLCQCVPNSQQHCWF